MGPGTHVDVILARITHLNLVLSHTDEEQMTNFVGDGCKCNVSEKLVLSRCSAPCLFSKAGAG